MKPKPVYEADIYVEHQEVRANRVDARMNRKQGENNGVEDPEIRVTELKQQFQVYEVRQYNISMDVSGGWSRELEIMELVEGRARTLCTT